MLEDLRMAISSATLSDSPTAVSPNMRASGKAILAPVRCTARPTLAMPSPSLIMRLLTCTAVFVAMVDANHSQDVHDLPVLISNDLPRPHAPANDAVAVEYSMLKHDIPAGLVTHGLA